MSSSRQYRCTSTVHTARSLLLVLKYSTHSHYSTVHTTHSTARTESSRANRRTNRVGWCLTITRTAHHNSVSQRTFPLYGTPAPSTPSPSSPLRASNASPSSVLQHFYGREEGAGVRGTYPHPRPHPNPNQTQNREGREGGV